MKYIILCYALASGSLLYSQTKEKTIKYTEGEGDSWHTKFNYIVFEQIDKFPPIADGYDMTNKIAVGAVLKVKTMDGDSFTAEPVYIIDTKTRTASTASYKNEQFGFEVTIQKINPKIRKFIFDITEQRLTSDSVKVVPSEPSKT